MSKSNHVQHFNQTLDSINCLKQHYISLEDKSILFFNKKHSIKKLLTPALKKNIISPSIVGTNCLE